MRRLLLALLTAVLVGGPLAGQLEAQRAAGADDKAGQEAKHQEPGIGFLLRHRAQLGLADQQITRLDEITQRLKAENEPLQQRLREAGIPVGPQRHAAIRAMTPEQRSALRERLEGQRPTLVQMRQNAERAMQQAREVLTPEQRQQLRQLSRAHAEEIRGGHGRDGKEAPRGQPVPRPPRNP